MNGADEDDHANSAREPTASPPPRLADLRRELGAAVTWNPDLSPEPATIRHTRMTERGGRGFYGEDQLARAASSRGEIILDCGSGPEGWNQHGPDLVTLAEAADGRLVVKFYDNKAYSAERNVSAVGALNRTLDLGGYVNEWKDHLAKGDSLSPAERKMFEAAIEVVETDPTRIERVVSNWNGRASGVTDRIAGDGIGFEDWKDTVPMNDRDWERIEYPPAAPPAEPPAAAVRDDPAPQASAINQVDREAAWPAWLAADAGPAGREAPVAGPSPGAIPPAPGMGAATAPGMGEATPPDTAPGGIAPPRSPRLR